MSDVRLGEHYVNGYTRSNGTYVAGHHQTNPNDSKYVLTGRRKEMSIRARARKGRSIRPGELFLLSTDDRSLDTHAVEQLLLLNGVSVTILKEEQIVSLAHMRSPRRVRSVLTVPRALANAYTG